MKSFPDHCRFRTSVGGVLYCQDPPYEHGLCRFHYEAYLRGELLSNGQINELLSDQDRRREINRHGIRARPLDYVLE